MSKAIPTGAALRMCAAYDRSSFRTLTAQINRLDSRNLRVGWTKVIVAHRTGKTRKAFAPNYTQKHKHTHVLKRNYHRRDYILSRCVCLCVCGFGLRGLYACMCSVIQSEQCSAAFISATHHFIRSLCIRTLYAQPLRIHN